MLPPVGEEEAYRINTDWEFEETRYRAQRREVCGRRKRGMEVVVPAIAMCRCMKKEDC